MKILDNYIGTVVIGGTLIVISVLLSLFVFIEFVAELNVIGKGSYGVYQAIQYILYSLPRLAYQLMPIAALLGSLMGLGMLASNNELVVMRASGVSLVRIIISVMKAGLLLVLFSMILGEFVVSKSEEHAQDIRAKALASHGSLKTGEGFWTRDGDRFINVRAVFPDGRLFGVNIFEFDKEQKLRVISSAGNADYEEGEWLLQNVKQSLINDDIVQTNKSKEINWQSTLSPELLDIIAVRPASLSIAGLYSYIKYLSGNDLDSARYEMELWTKILLPFATGVMVFLSVPFVFGPLRSVGAGQKILVGTLVGIGFYLSNQILSYVALIYGLNSFLSAVAPTILFFSIAVVMVRRIF